MGSATQMVMSTSPGTIKSKWDFQDKSIGLPACASLFLFLLLLLWVNSWLHIHPPPGSRQDRQKSVSVLYLVLVQLNVLMREKKTLTLNWLHSGLGITDKTVFQKDNQHL